MFYPIYLDLHGRPCLVVGGGPIATGKVRGLVEAGALVTVVAPTVSADVVAWHAHLGNKLDPNTQVWATLPRPWDVITGQAECTRAMVVAACREAGVDPAKSGWTAPRSYERVAKFHATPELVHGVTVASPHFAKLMRQMGYFSGKSKQPT